MKSVFEELNSEQTKAVKEVGNPLLIIAGAGSGKTLTVASKIAYLIVTGRQNREYPCLSFQPKGG